MIIPEIHLIFDLIFDLILFDFRFNFHIGTTPSEESIAGSPPASRSPKCVQQRSRNCDVGLLPFRHTIDTTGDAGQPSENAAGGGSTKEGLGWQRAKGQKLERYS